MTEDFSPKWAATRSLDRIDAVLLDAVRTNGRLRLEDLARRVELSPSSVHERLRRLERTGSPSAGSARWRSSMPWRGNLVFG